VRGALRGRRRAARRSLKSERERRARAKCGRGPASHPDVVREHGRAAIQASSRDRFGSPQLRTSAHFHSSPTLTKVSQTRAPGSPPGLSGAPTPLRCRTRHRAPGQVSDERRCPRSRRPTHRHRAPERRSRAGPGRRSPTAWTPAQLLPAARSRPTRARAPGRLGAVLCDERHSPLTRYPQGAGTKGAPDTRPRERRMPNRCDDGSMTRVAVKRA